MNKLLLIACSLLFAGILKADDAMRAASEQLIARILPAQASSFRVEIIESPTDRFEIEGKDGKIMLRGNNGVSIASALNHYLKYSCNAHISWNGDNLNLPSPLPVPEQKIVRSTALNDRVYLNYCTVSYTMAWWDWKRWEREIDWMALHGINMPLAVIGQEAVWQQTLSRFGMNDDEIRQFLVGPAFQAWQWMTNIETYGGPLPQAWIDSHVELGQRILKRQRELGMRPILQSFTGFVPAALKGKYPDAAIKPKNRWCNAFDATVQLDPLDPLFAKMGAAFLQEQEKLFGTDHLYAADPFHEGAAPSNEKSYLEQVGNTIWKVVSDHDPKAIVAMQTWSLREPIARAFPQDRLLLLDLGGWNTGQYKGFWGYPYVAGILHNYGGRVYTGGNLALYARNAHELKQGPHGANLAGIGLFPEAIEHNPVVYELGTEITWMNEAPVLRDWVIQYAASRYGKLPESIEQGWDILLATVYGPKANRLPSMETAMCARPALEITKVAANGDMARPYRLPELWNAVDCFLKASGELKDSDTYRFDLVDITRQCLADLALPLHRRMADAWKRGDDEAFNRDAALFLELIDDTDRLLATRSTFLLGKWIADARAWGTTGDEKNLYEWNARTLVTVWGPRHPSAHLFEYSNRQWAGLMKGYYKPRWEKFIAYLKAQPKGEGRYDESKIKKSLGSRPAQEANEFFTRLTDWEYAWAHGHESYPAQPQGDEIAVSRELYGKWLPVITELSP